MKVVRSFGDYEITYERESNQHRLSVRLGARRDSGDWLPIEIPLTWQSNDGTLSIVGQAYTNRLPALFEIREGKGMRLSIMPG